MAIAVSQSLIKEPSNPVLYVLCQVLGKGSLNEDSLTIVPIGLATNKTLAVVASSLLSRVKRNISLANQNIR